jgi:hypothetical protein
MKQLILGFCGAAGAGKDTVAQYIYEYAGPLGSARRLAFAEPMRDMLLALGIPEKYMYDRELKEQPVPGFGRSYRQLAQTLGTEWGRQLHGENFWVNALAARVAKAKEDIILISDVRFPNEVEWLHRTGGFLVKVHRPGVAAIEQHESEMHYHNFLPDIYLLNDAGKDNLKEEALRALREAITRRIHGFRLLAV